MPAKDPGERRALATIAALSRAATTSGADMLEPANNAYRNTFNTGHACRLCPAITISQDLPREEITRRGYALYCLHMRRLALDRDRNRRLAAAATAEADQADAELTAIAAG